MSEQEAKWDAAGPSGVLRWLMSTDHKKVGILYMATGFLFFFIAGGLAMLIRTELIRPGPTITNPETYLGWVSMHGTLMIFLWLTPFFTGLISYLLPLMIGARDVAFPRLNALAFWLELGGGLVLLSSFAFRTVPSAGWTAYPPFSDLYSGSGIDPWILGIALVGISSTLAGINFVVTTFYRRAPGMRMMRMPLFCWASLITGWLMLLGNPSLTVAVAGLFFERHLGVIFYSIFSSPGNPVAPGGTPLLYEHLFWFFGHPEVYILILPGFGVISEVIPVFSRKPLFGYRMMVISISAIAFLSLIVWAHHMFVSGMAMRVLLFFMGSTLLIAVFTGVKMFNWVATLWRGHIHLTTSMLFALGFLVSFTIGGLSGVMQAAIPFDMYVTDSYFIVAHLHYVFFGGSVMTIFAAIYLWFPKMFGRMLDEKLGVAHFLLTFVGTYITYFPYHWLGFLGMVRRVFDYPPEWASAHLVSSIGAYILGAGQLVLLVNIVRSARRGPAAGPNPWRAESLEWSVPSPPPEGNFEVIPVVTRPEYGYDLHPDEGPPEQE